MGPYHHNNHELKAAEMLKVPIDQTVHPKQWPGDSRFVQQDFKGDLGTKRLLHNRIWWCWTGLDDAGGWVYAMFHSLHHGGKAQILEYWLSNSNHYYTGLVLAGESTSLSGSGAAAGIKTMEECKYANDWHLHQFHDWNYPTGCKTCRQGRKALSSPWASA